MFSRTVRGAMALALTTLGAACSGGGEKAQPQPPPPPVGTIQVTDSAGQATDHALAFGDVTVGSSVSATVTIANVGSLDLLLGAIPDANPVSAPFSVGAGNCSARLLAPAESCAFTVTFAPAGKTTFSDSFDIPSGDAAAPVVTVTLSGAGTAVPGKAIRITEPQGPTDDLAIPFGSWGETMTWKVTVRATNSGSDPLTLGTIGGADALSAPFTLDRYQCTPGKVLASGASCLFTVSFTPPEVGTWSDTFDVPSDADAAPVLTMTVSGSGIRNASGTLVAFDTAEPMNDRVIAFGEVPIGTTARHAVTLRNIGATSVEINSLPWSDDLAAPFAIGRSRCSPYWTVAPWDTCYVTIEFTPTSAGTFVDTFDWFATPSTGWKISLSGTGTSSGTPAATTALPTTGQTTCHDAAGSVIACAGSGLDGELRLGVVWPTPRFVAGIDAEAGCVTDALTGLMWTQDADLPAAAGTWRQALDWVAAQNAGAGLCGHNDWHLPNVNELRTLSNLGEASLAAWLNAAAQGFANVQGAGYWTSTIRENQVTGALRLSMTNGQIDYAPTTEAGRVWAVRDTGAAAPSSAVRTGAFQCSDTSGRSIPCAGSGQDGALKAGLAWPQTRFLVNADETVTDVLTGLSWDPDATQGNVSCYLGDASRSWAGGRSYVACLNSYAYLGHTDWRVPNANELWSLFHGGDHRFLDKMLLTSSATSATEYWSSDSCVAAPTNAWAVEVRLGTQRSTYKGSTLGHVWAVRGG